MNTDKDHLSDPNLPTAIMIVKSNELYLSFKGACQKLSISTSTGRLWRNDEEKQFPEPVVINGVNRYRDSDIEKMIADQNKDTEEKSIINKSSNLKKKA